MTGAEGWIGMQSITRIEHQKSWIHFSQIHVLSFIVSISLPLSLEEMVKLSINYFITIYPIYHWFVRIIGRNYYFYTSEHQLVGIWSSLIFWRFTQVIDAERVCVDAHGKLYCARVGNLKLPVNLHKNSCGWFLLHLVRVKFKFNF